MLNLINIDYYIMLIKPYIVSRIITKGRLGSGGQALLEYGIILTLVVTALIGMQLYAQRALQARYKDATDQVVYQLRQAKKDGGLLLQYEPYYQESNMKTKSDSKVTQSYLPNGATTTVIEKDRSLRQGIRRELPYSDERGK